MASAHGLKLSMPEGAVQEDLISLALWLAQRLFWLLDVGAGKVGQFRNVIQLVRGNDEMPALGLSLAPCWMDGRLFHC